jgi:thiamine biosynthesis lipoprotein
MSWIVGIEDPHHPERDVLVVNVPAGSRVGIATSGTHRRRWFASGREVHHLIDPRAGSPTREEIRSVTALSSTATAAEIAAKAVLIAASESSIRDLFGASAVVLIAANGHVELLKRAPEHTDDIERLTAAGHAA